MERIFPALAGILALVVILVACAEPRPERPSAAIEVAPLPQRLSETGLFTDATARTIDPAHLAFTPQYPLWTDGATKRRWLHLPAGTSIDAAQADAWEFPVGTKFWKEFAFGRPVETRYIEFTTAGWRFATYQWAEDGSDAVLVAERGIAGVVEIAPGVRHDIPSRQDCLACHGNRSTPILGFSALQLSDDRDPLAPHGETLADDAETLGSLVARGLVRNVGEALLEKAPRIEARTPRERASLGWLHANCGSCHVEGGSLSGLGFALDQRVAGHMSPRNVLENLIDEPSRFRPRSYPKGRSVRIAPRRPDASVLLARIASREPAEQMPPLGTRLVDREAQQLLEAWVREDLLPPALSHPVPGDALAAHERKDPTR